MFTVFSNFEVFVPFKLNVLVRRRAHITSMAPFTTHMRAMEVRGRPRRQLISSCFAARILCCYTFEPSSSTWSVNPFRLVF